MNNLNTAITALTATQNSGAVGCGFCTTTLPDDLTGWTARDLSTELSWRIPGVDHTVLLPAKRYALCPSCEELVANRRAGTMADIVLAMLGANDQERAVIRSELLGYFLAVIHSLGDPISLTDLVNGGEDAA